MDGLKGKQHSPVINSLISGLLGGLAGAVAMSKFQMLWNKALDQPRKEPTDIVACTKISSRVSSRYGLHVPDAALRRSAIAMHYAFGAGAGALYGLIREVGPAELPSVFVTIAGATLGSSMFIGADEIGTPMLGFEKGSLVGTRVYGLTSHIVFGAVSAAACEQIRSFIG